MHSDMAELRFDLLNPDQRALAEGFPQRTGLPMILTIRRPEDGGHWPPGDDAEEERQAWLVRLLESGGWDYVDLEDERPMAMVVAVAEASGTRIIRSRHDFQGSLFDGTTNGPVSEIVRLVRNMGQGGAIPKLAIRCGNSRQLLALARAALALDDVSEKVLLGMGEYGTPSRILAERMGSLWTYSSPAEPPVAEPPAAGSAAFKPTLAAPGQLDPETLQELYRFGKIDRSTPLYAVIGNPIAHSRSPVIHNRWLIESGLDGCYLPIRSDDAAATLETCDIWGISGLSVTVPHKETCLKLCDYADHLARRIGAANTLLRAGDGWRARNTDAEGFIGPLPAALGLSSSEKLQGLRALIIGAGGAAKAAVYALSDAGVSMVILNRTFDKAQALAQKVGAVAGPLDASSKHLLGKGIDIVVQTTSVGMHPNENADPIPWFDFQGTQLVYDMVYEPRETCLLSRARHCGVKTLNGLAMLETQGKLQFLLFTGKSLDNGNQPD